MSARLLEVWCRVFEFALNTVCGAIMLVIQFFCSLGGHTIVTNGLGTFCQYCFKKERPK